MPRWSERVSLPGGGVAIVCYQGRAKRPREACSCGRSATLQCDYPVAHGRTCDAFICTRCADRVSGCVDYCPGHARQGLLAEPSVAPMQKSTT